MGNGAAQQPAGTKQEPKISQPLTGRRTVGDGQIDSTAHSARLWWNDGNRVIGASSRGTGCHVTNARVGRHALPGLRTVVLVTTPHSPLTDDGLAPPHQLPRLELLSISGNRITDAAMVHVGQMHNLRTARAELHITDSGLGQLSELTNLEQLDLTQARSRMPGMTSTVEQFRDSRRWSSTARRSPTSRCPPSAKLKTLERLYLGNTPSMTRPSRPFNRWSSCNCCSSSTPDDRPGGRRTAALPSGVVHHRPSVGDLRGHPQVATGHGGFRTPSPHRPRPTVWRAAQ